MLTLANFLSCSNGCDNEYQFDYPDNVTFDSSIVLAPGDFCCLSP